MFLVPDASCDIVAPLFLDYFLFKLASHLAPVPQACGGPQRNLSLRTHMMTKRENLCLHQMFIVKF